VIDLDAVYLSEELRAFRAAFRKYVQREIVPRAPQWEMQGGIPRDAVRQMGALGLLGTAIPPAFGGSGLDALGTVVFGEELGRSSFGGVASSVSDHADMAAPVLVRSGSPEQQQRFLPRIATGELWLGFAVTEPGGGSDLARMQTQAQRDGEHWVFNGQKTFITNALSADAFITVARTDPNARGAQGYSLFIVEKGAPGLTVGQRFDKTGWRSGDMSALFFDNFRVPAANLIGEEGRGFYLLMQGLERERMSLCAQCVGMMERAVEITLAHVKARTAYGKTLWDLQAMRHEMAEYVSDLSALKLMLYHAAAQKNRGASTRLETSMLKARAPELLKRLADGCVQMHGATGYMQGTEIERIWRDARPFSLGGGAAKVMLDEVAKLL
jgi:acyl-CoA dehydrogenase